MKHEIDILWIGLEPTNPFAIQEIAEALKGSNIPIMVKNPINPELNLWIGAIERLMDAGIKKIAAIHRGFLHIKVLNIETLLNGKLLWTYKKISKNSYYM